MTTDPRDILPLLADGHSLATEEAEALVDRIVDGELSEIEVAAALTALRVRGETVEELTGAARAMRRRMIPLGTTIPGLLDTAGTGGVGSSTFNISTATAIVVAGAGVPVAKHGNRSVSSTSGSADVLACLGFPLEATVDAVRASLEQAGLSFFFAPQWHPAMKNVAHVRKTLRFRTLFNLVGPLCNPARADYHLLGVGREEWLEPMARAINNLGAVRATVVRGSDGLGEVTLAGPTTAMVVRNRLVQRETWTPASFGLETIDGRAIVVSSPAESAERIRGLLDGELGPCRDMVLANAAAALWTVGSAAGQPVDSLKIGVEIARESIDSGAAKQKLADFLALSQK